jgi:hypothetical protein
VVLLPDYRINNPIFACPSFLKKGADEKGFWKGFWVNPFEKWFGKRKNSVPLSRL